MQQSLSIAAAMAAETSEEAGNPYPLWARMLIILGGSALLWALLGSLGNLAKA